MKEMCFKSKSTNGKQTRKTVVGIAMLLLSMSHMEAEELTPAYIYDVEINVKSTKENGKTWDIAGGAPELLLKVDNDMLSMKKSCLNTYRCTVSFVSNKTRWYFENYDRDIATNDLIGKGVCSVGKVCNLGRSTIKIERRQVEDKN